MHLFNIDMPQSDLEFSFYVVAATKLDACRLFVTHLVENEYCDADDEDLAAATLRVFDRGPTALGQGVLSWEEIPCDVVGHDEIPDQVLSEDSDKLAEVISGLEGLADLSPAQMTGETIGHVLDAAAAALELLKTLRQPGEDEAPCPTP